MRFPLFRVLYFRRRRYLKNFAQFIIFLIVCFVIKRYLHIQCILRDIKQLSLAVSEETLLLDSEIDKLLQLISDTEDTRVLLILNQYAFNITSNWLCHTAGYKNLHKRLILISLDSSSANLIEKHWPKIDTISLDVNGLGDTRFHHMDRSYQLYQVFRSNLIALLLEQTDTDFWLIQADAYWSRDAIMEFETVQSESNKEIHAAFDVTNPVQSSGFVEIAGGFIFINKNAPIEAFRSLTRYLLSWYGPDNAYLVYMCYTKMYNLQCEAFDSQHFAGWRWGNYADGDQLPASLQFDNGQDTGGKEFAVRNLGLWFWNDNAECSWDLVEYKSTKEERKKTAKRVKYRVKLGRERQLEAQVMLGAAITGLPIVGNWLKPRLPLLGYITSPVS